MRFITALLGLMCAVPIPLAYAAEPAAKADPAQAQAIVTKVCAACHATDGNSVSPANPVLAGQHADYSYAQLKAFKAGERGADKEGKDVNGRIMVGIASRMSDDQMKAAAEYTTGLH